MISFGLVAEGETDHIVLQSIIEGVFKDHEPFITPLQPQPGESGNWDKVFKYCCSEEFKSALAFNDYLIVQIDTDVLFREQLPQKYQIDLNPQLSTSEVIELVKDKLIELIDNEAGFWEENGHQIIFAVSVDEIECWFLPIYFTNQPRRAGKTTGCIRTLNRVSQQREGFTIGAKNLRYYRTISKKLKKNIERFHPQNESLKIFVETLKETIPEIVESYEEE